MKGPRIYVKSMDVDKKTHKKLRQDLKYYLNKKYEEEDYYISGWEIFKLFYYYMESTGFHYYTEYATFYRGMECYRTRAVKTENYKGIIDRKEFLSPPPGSVGWGRVNPIKEPMLYTSSEKETAFLENDEIEDLFIMIHIKIRTDIRVNSINTLMSSNPRLIKPKKNIRAFKHFDNFLLKLILTKRVDNSNYILTNSILRAFYPESEKRGYYYPSVANPGGYNVAFNPKFEKEHLRVFKVELISIDKNNFKVEEVFYF